MWLRQQLMLRLFVGLSMLLRSDGKLKSTWGPGAYRLEPMLLCGPMLSMLSLRAPSQGTNTRDEQFLLCGCPVQLDSWIRFRW